MNPREFGKDGGKKRYQIQIENELYQKNINARSVDSGITRQFQHASILKDGFSTS